MNRSEPSLLGIPWANGANPANVHTIPTPSQVTTDPQRASWNDGFPPITMLRESAGGLPPYGQDFNGVIKYLSSHLVFLNAGGQYRFDDAFSVAIGGYPSGAVLQSDDGLSAYVSVIENNTTNFNTNPASIGVVWMPYAGLALKNSFRSSIMNNLVRSLKHLVWSVGLESYVGPGITNKGAWTGITASFYYDLHQPLSAAASWALFSPCGSVGQVVTGDTYITVADLTGSGILTNFILPGFNAAGGVNTIRVTIDGTVETIAFSAINATDRFFSGAARKKGQYTLSFDPTGANLTNSAAPAPGQNPLSSWTGGAIEGGLAFRLDPQIIHMITAPPDALGKSPCLEFSESLKIEMKASAVNTTNYRNYCGAVYYLHP